MEPVSYKTIRSKKSPALEMDLLSLDGSECYYDLDTFVKIPTARQDSSQKKKNEPDAETAKESRRKRT